MELANHWPLISDAMNPFTLFLSFICLFIYLFITDFFSFFHTILVLTTGNCKCYISNKTHTSLDVVISGISLLERESEMLSILLSL